MGVVVDVISWIVASRAGSILLIKSWICCLVLGAKLRSSSMLSMPSWVSIFGAICCQLGSSAVSLMCVAAVKPKPCSVMELKIRIASFSFSGVAKSD